MDDFLSAEEQAALLKLWGDAEFVEAEARHYGFDNTGFSAEMEVSAHPLLAKVLARLDEVLDARSVVAPSLRFRYYQEGQGRPPHTDTYSIDEGTLGLTAMLCLAAPNAGGETVFPEALPSPLVVEPRPGRLLCWTSTLPDGQEDPRSRHAGLPVVSGAKAILLAFYYLAPSEHGPEKRVLKVGPRVGNFAGDGAAE